MLPPYQAAVSSKNKYSPYSVQTNTKVGCQTNPGFFQTKYKDEHEKSGLSQKDQTVFVCFCNHCFGQKGWFVNTFVDCMIAKIIPPAACWAMHAASDPQPNAADSAIEKREKSAIEKSKLFRFVSIFATFTTSSS